VARFYLDHLELNAVAIYLRYPSSTRSPIFTTMAFIKNPLQVQAQRLMNKHTHTMLAGGSRSGKSAIIFRQIVLRALTRASRHLIVRYRFNHARTSLAHDTIPKVLKMCFPGIICHENKADSYYSIPSQDGGLSEIWLGGTDDKTRLEKVLGNEYSTLWFNECSQIPPDAVPLLLTRLAENTGHKLRAFYDENPSGTKSWTNLMFNKGQHPNGEPHNYDTEFLRINPKDNARNLPPEYLEMLQSLPLRQRQRFWDGLYLDDIEGALWNAAMIVQAQSLEWTTPIYTVIGVDPAVTNNPLSDEWGIVAASMDDLEQVVIQDDWSGKFSVDTAAQRVVNAYHEFEANAVVAEINQGGDLVESVIRNIDPTIKVIKVSASKSKFARAEPVSQLYELGKVAHSSKGDLAKLEEEMTTSVFKDLKESPNRIDALVWAVFELYQLGEKQPGRWHVG